MKHYAISDSRLLGGVERLPEWVASLDREGVEMVQIREKSLPAADLVRVVRACLARSKQIRLLVNARIDIALACGAHGAHLPGDSPPPSIWRGIAPSPFQFGVSCHTLQDAQAAEAGGADFIVVSPVFDPLSKAASREALGVEGLRLFCRSVALPVYALGGITRQNAAACISAGAAGVAGITLYSG